MGQWEAGEETETEKKKPTVGWINGRDTPVKKLVADV